MEIEGEEIVLAVDERDRFKDEISNSVDDVVAFHGCLLVV
jgi:hypothetical protein